MCRPSLHHGAGCASFSCSKTHFFSTEIYSVAFPTGYIPFSGSAGGFQSHFRTQFVLGLTQNVWSAARLARVFLGMGIGCTNVSGLYPKWVKRLLQIFISSNILIL
jgi:hypothetical protein